ncbi:PAS domain-containing protein, partial [bacterium]|nr:PAS domain-containing protein [bacterium]
MDNRDFNILVGDSDPETVNSIKRTLQEEKFGVWTSSEPGGVLRIIESGKIDLIILDVKIYAQLVHHEFKIETRDERDPPVIILTTDEDFNFTVEAIKGGAVDFLDKPIRVKRLLITIRNALLHSSKLKQMRHDQEELASLKELYERIINGIDYGLVVIDKDLRIESINEPQRRKRRQIGIDPLGLPCHSYFYDSETICDDCRIQEVFEKGRPVKYNLVNRAVGGFNYYLEVEAFPLFDTKGEVVRVVQLIKDVTERVQLEKELWMKKEYLENLVRHAPIGIFTTDCDGFIRTANPAIAKLMGVKSPNDAIGINVLESTDFKNLGLDRGFRRVLEKGDTYEIEALNCRQLWNRDTICSLLTVPLRGGDDEVTGLIATLTDVTEKWQLEESYLKRITELSIFKEIGELLQASNDLSDIYHIALIGVTAGRALGFHRAFLLRYDRDENVLIGEKAIGPSDADEAGKIWSDVYQKDLTLAEIFEDHRKSPVDINVKVNQIIEGWRIPMTWEEGFFHDVLYKGQPQKVDLRQQPITADLRLISEEIGSTKFAAAQISSRGRVEGMIIADNAITGEEITDEDVNRLSIITNQVGTAIENSQLLKSLEEKVKALRKAYQALQENRDLLLRAERLSVVGEVAASVAHEIRNPLTSIGGFTRAILRDLETPKKLKTNQRFLKIILEEVKRLERIVNETLGFVRPVTPRFVYADLNKIIDQTFSMMSGEIDEKRIVITKDFQKGLASVWMDADQIRQVLMNLFRNAIHAMQNGGMLSIITTGDDDYVKAHISDTGHGIPEEHKTKLFKAFFTTKSTGSGLGLTISNQIIKNHAGTIEVESSEGEGTTFIITLPVRGG